MRNAMMDLADDNGLTLRTPADEFEIGLYKSAIKATIAKFESDILYGHIGDYNDDGTWSFAVMQKTDVSWSKLITGTKSLHGTIAVFDRGGKIQVVWEVRSDDAGELDCQSNYAEYPPAVSWALDGVAQ